jgi:hypothetical protein
MITSTTGPASYGPSPPEAGEQPTGYPPGENCAFVRDAATGLPVPRLALLGGDPDRRALVPLTAAELGDGNLWCPSAAAPNRFDADALRIRKVTITIAVESALDALRGPAGVLFRRAGTSIDGGRLLPDRTMRLQITPPNLATDR